jgi:hypothetical protein
MNYFFNARAIAPRLLVRVYNIHSSCFIHAIAPRLLVRVYNIHSSCFIHGARLTSIRAPKDANPS